MAAPILTSSIDHCLGASYESNHMKHGLGNLASSRLERIEGTSLLIDSLFLATIIASAYLEHYSVYHSSPEVTSFIC